MTRITCNMSKQANQPIIITNGNLEVNYKNKNIDFLDLIESEGCKQPEFCTGCPNCRLSCIKNLKFYLKSKLEDMKLQTVDYKSHFKKLCFNCSSSFHGSNHEDGYFNLQKMFGVENECKSCQKRYTTDRSFLHKCNICIASFKNCTILAYHRSVKHNSKKPHQCAVCQISLSDGGLTNHIRQHTLPHLCLYCSKRCATKSDLKLHTLSHNGNKQYACRYCPKQFKLKKSLDYHIFEHTGGKKFKCDFCDKTFAKRFLLNEHRTIHIWTAFQCKYCPKQYKRKQYLNVHLSEHTGVKEFECEFCNKTFSKKFVLNHHKRIHIEKQAFPCKYCSKQYKSKYWLDVHLFEHTGVKNFKCDLCDKTFGKLYLLNQHKSNHNRIEKSFQCKFCPKHFKTKQCFNVHQFEHTGIKKYKCELCNKTFAKAYILNRHKLIHMEKSFQCTICLNFYKTPRRLANHITREHKSLNDQ